MVHLNGRIPDTARYRSTADTLARRAWRSLTTTITAIAALGSWVVACSDGSGPKVGESQPAALRVVRGLLSDTVFSFAPAPVEVEVRSSDGLPWPRVVVVFRPLLSTDHPLSQSVYIEDSRRPGVFSTAPQSDTTDAAGRASVRVRLGRYAGPAGLSVAIPPLGLSDTIRVTILRGNVVRLSVEPKDTALYVGQSFQLRPVALDAYDNVSDTIATFGGAVGSVSVNASGCVTGQSVGRAAVAYALANQLDSVRVSVVPPGTIAVHLSRENFGDSLGVGVLNLDGSGFRRVAIETPPRTYGGDEPTEHEMAPRWTPDGTTVVYQESRAASSANTVGLGQWRIFTSDLAGNTRRLFEPLQFLSDAHPNVSPDGSTIYFVGRLEGIGDRIWKYQIAGASASRVMSEVGNEETRPAVSPDGRHLAYVVGGSSSNRLELAVVDLATGASRRLGIEGTSPRWSPRGDLIAYVQAADRSGASGRLRVVRPDGSDDRDIVGSRTYAPVIDWSPDGRYLIAARDSHGKLELIDISTGLVLPLPYGSRMSQPAWKPGTPPTSLTRPGC